jgi:AGCS family alanine or glycine:cation symporter
MSFRPVLTRLLPLAMALAAPVQAAADDVATAVPTLDERIDAAVKPVADAISGFIFHAVRIGGTDAAPTMFPLILGWLVAAGVVFTLYFRFINVRGFRHGLQLIRGRYAESNAPGEVSHFQALTSAISGTVGLGNIAGVAVALSVGGAGATFWMVLAGLLGMSSKFVECTLGVKYRLEKPDGTVSGGPMYYLSRGIAINYPGLKGFGWTLAVVYALCTLLGAIGAGCMFQANQAYAQFLAVTGGADGPLAGRGWLFGAGIAVLAGIVLIGGITRIGSVTAKLVPGMAILYLAGGLVVVFTNLGHLPAAFGAIFDGAFTADGVQGGVIGALIQGFRRAAFSNEAGLGSAAIAHSTVRTREPVTEGFVALWEPFIDTVVICTMTALVIIISGELSALQGSALSGTAQGVALTSKAFATVIWWFPYVLTLVVFLFAFSTIITWGYYGAKAASFLARESKLALYGFKLFFLAMAVVGASMNLGSIVDIADALMFIMAIPNLIGVYLLMPAVKRELASYEARLRSGEIRPTAALAQPAG